jgi:alkaline phosphatase
MKTIKNILAVFLILILSANAQNNKPKNIIILIGDGMGIGQLSASVLSLENDPYRNFTSIGFSITCSADKLITDSAAGATAIATGYRTNYYYVSIDPETEEDQLTLFEHAEKFNISTGVIATSTITHATPAAFLSHVKSRKDEHLIAEQFLNRNVDVVIGGGAGFFIPKSQQGLREDNLNLVEKINSRGYKYFNNYEDLKSRNNTDKFYALLEPAGLKRASERNYSLGDLTSIALETLSKNENGFMLMVEGSQIDWASHDHLTDHLLSELEDFNEAINVALEFAEKDGNTLILITADHETGGASINGGTVDGKDLVLKYTTGGHTAGLVGVFAKGPGEELFRGVYENYMIGRKLFNLLDETIQF